MTTSKINGLADFLEISMEKYADNPAFHCLGKTMTFAEIDQKSRAFAAWLQAQPNISAGDRVAIQLPNLLQYPIVAYGVLRAGLVVVNTNPLYTAREMEHQFNDSGAKAIIILSDLLPVLEGIKANTKLETIIATGVADMLSDAVAPAAEGVLSLTEVLQEGAGLALQPRPELNDQSPCILQYTGGTTGLSKGATLTNHSLMTNAEQTLEHLGDYCGEGTETFVCPLPLYHIYAFMVNMVMFAGRGNLNILIPNPRDIEGFINAIKPFQFTGFAGLNTLFVGLCSVPAFRELDFSKLHLTISGGTTLTSAAADIWKEITGCTITEGYGLSETSPVLCFNRPKAEMLGTVGVALSHTEVEFWDENDQPVADGEAGQLVARGPQIMQGYWNKPEETAKVITPEGFFKTGDIGLRLPSGHIKIVDRLKDMIIVSGFNVYPNEIEDVLTKHPTILEAAVVGEADDKSGEKVVAYITVSGETSTDQVIEFCRESLTPYKVPKKVVILDELPKSAVGKVLRRELRK